ncbi:MAG: hypothetical protein KGL69_09695, partial [Alphaproteobacteria bacterium]|nr:hypothetical protein [Alphaproteobacteria bacterium]
WRGGYGYYGGWGLGLGFGLGLGLASPWYWSPWYGAAAWYGWAPWYGWDYPAYDYGYAPAYDYGGDYPPPQTAQPPAANPDYGCDGWRWDAEAGKYVPAKVSCD